MRFIYGNNQSGKISHPENTGDGHGDGADGLAGAYYNALLHEAEYSDTLTHLQMLSPADGDIDKEQILKIAAGIVNLQYEEQVQRNTYQREKQNPVEKHSNISNWIL